MLVVRDIHYIKINGNLYVKNTASNDLLRLQIEQMGKVSVMAWITEDPNEKAKNLYPLLQSPNLEVIEIPADLPFRKKVLQIKKIVKQAESLSIKFCFIDSFIACHYARKYKKPYIIESGSDAFTSSWFHGGSLKYKIFAIPYEFLTKYYHAKAKNIIYVSKTFLQRKYPSKAYQIGCSDAVITDVGLDVLNRRISKIQKSRNYKLGLIGNTSVEYRGHDTLIDVMRLLREKGYNVQVCFAGSDTGKAKRMEFATSLGVEKYVHFDGYLSKEEIYTWIDGIDILVMPTLQETLGRAVIEAMSRGCPVIGSIETALPEQLGSDCIAPARDVDGIARIIENMIIDVEYMKLCSIENYWRAKKYSNSITGRIRKIFYDDFYERNGLKSGR